MKAISRNQIEKQAREFVETVRRDGRSSVKGRAQVSDEEVEAVIRRVVAQTERHIIETGGRVEQD